MPAPVVEALVAGRPCVVMAALVDAVRVHGGTVAGVGGYGSVVCWRTLDSRLELVELQAEVVAVEDQPEVSRVRVTRVDAAIASTEHLVTPPRRRDDLPGRDAG